MAAQWFLARGGKKYGPYSMEQLRQFVASGNVLPTDMLLPEGQRQWVAANALPGLFPTTAVKAQPVAVSLAPAEIALPPLPPLR